MSDLLVEKRAGSFSKAVKLILTQVPGLKVKTELLKLRTEGQTIYRKPDLQVTKLKSKFCLFLG